jgi:hypothetical protein
MNQIDWDRVSDPARPTHPLAVAATFTAEPIEEVLRFWMDELVLFRATRGTGMPSDEPYVERYDDPLFGWGRRATRGVQTIDVPGGHSSMLQEPNVDVLAEQMQIALDRVLARESAAPAAEFAPSSLVEDGWDGGKKTPPLCPADISSHQGGREEP